jgi:hypothetical protein
MSLRIIVAIIGSASTLIIIIVLAALIYKGVLRFPKKENLTEYEVTPYPVPKVQVSPEATHESGQSFDFGNTDSNTIGIHWMKQIRVINKHKGSDSLFAVPMYIISRSST